MKKIKVYKCVKEPDGKAYSYQRVADINKIAEVDVERLTDFLDFEMPERRRICENYAKAISKAGLLHFKPKEK